MFFWFDTCSHNSFNLFPDILLLDAFLFTFLGDGVRSLAFDIDGGLFFGSARRLPGLVFEVLLILEVPLAAAPTPPVASACFLLVWYFALNSLMYWLVL